MFAESGDTSSVFVALHDAGETVRVLARLGDLEHSERARLKSNIRLLLSAHGVHQADVVVQEQSPTRRHTSKRG